MFFDITCTLINFTVCYYYVEVYTSEESGSGTDANVHINIHGKHGDCGIRRLKHSLVDGDKFETAKVFFKWKIYVEIVIEK